MGVQGEVEKWISISEARFNSIEAVDADEIVVEVSGLHNETIAVGFIDDTLQQVVVTCTFDDSTLEKRPVASSLLPGKSTLDYLGMRVSSKGSCD